MRSHHRYALVGIVLGLGAPVGSLVLRSLIGPRTSFWGGVQYEWETAAFYYRYMLVGTTTAFGLFGYVIGRLHRSLEDLSVTDGLTQLFNHRYLQEHLATETIRADRYKTSITCMMMDIDDFKKVNDTFGHPFGDQVLVRIAELIQEAVRKTDVAGRYGGEEFLIIMPHTDEAAALPLAERILTAVSDYPFKSGDTPIHVTLSIGVATYPAPQMGIKTKNGILSAADQALYTAKRTGKNQISVWRA